MRGTRSSSWTRAPRRRSQGRRCARRCAGARTGSRSCRLGWPRCYASWTASQSDRVSLRGMYPIFVVLLDGLADRAHDSLGGRTANEAADTPNLDRLARGGSACAEPVVDVFCFTLAHSARGEAALRVSPEADDRVTDTDVFFKDRYPALRPQAQAPEAEATAHAAEA